MITREMIEARLASLQKQRKDAVATVHAIDGALQECAYWLSKLAKDASPNPENVPASGE